MACRYNTITVLPHRAQQLLLHHSNAASFSLRASQPQQLPTSVVKSSATSGSAAVVVPVACQWYHQ
eukprot:18822-Heterococcus_DN1.PRE.3